jgi:hypothetical protein
MAGGMSFGEFNARHLDPFIDDLENARLKTITKAVAQFAQATATAEASADLGGWAPLLDTKARDLSPGQMLFTPTRSSAGPWTVAEFGRNSKAGPRMVGPRLTKTGRVSKARQKRWNGITQGKGTATRVTQRIDAETPQIVDREVGKAIRKFFR